MPLDKSGTKKAFSNNIRTEMAAGKPQKQAIAIAYSTQGENKKMKHEHKVGNPHAHLDAQMGKEHKVKDPGYHHEGGMKEGKKKGEKSVLSNTDEHEMGGE